MSRHLTNQQLRDLLAQLGFQPRDSVEPKCLVFEHPESHTRLLLPSNRDSEDARSADAAKASLLATLSATSPKMPLKTSCCTGSFEHRSNPV